MKPLISVIVPVYNVEKYIEKCLDSILKQTFKDFELLLINDGSTDSSAAICVRYAKTDNRVRVFHKENGGASSARNLGLDMAVGKYIAFVDSDDWITLDMLEVLYTNLISCKADISMCGLVKTRKDEDTKKSAAHDKAVTYTNMEILHRLHDEDVIMYSVLWNKLYKAGLFTGIRFPQGRIHEDDYVNYKLIYRSKSIVLTKQKMYYYRIRSNSVMGKKFNLSRLDILEVIFQRLLFFKTLKDKSLYQKELIYLLKKITWLYENIKKYISDNKTVLRMLRKVYRKYYLELLFTGYKTDGMLGYAINMIVPDLYMKEN